MLSAGSGRPRTIRFGGCIVRWRGESPEAAAIEARSVEWVRERIAQMRLTDREREVLRRRLDGETLEAIAQDLEVHRERVRQIESSVTQKILKRLRPAVERGER